jgi:hypothetical protein
VSCIDGPTLANILRATKDGKTGYQKVRTPNVEAAYAVDYGVDQMPWDSDSHALREQTPFMAMSIESGRYEPDPTKGTGERELSVGTDIMDDAYYDTPDFIVTDNQEELRARARWDTPTEIRRILIGNKVGSTVDPLGIKKDAKEDEREDAASAEQVASLDHDTRRGFVNWTGTDAAVTPVRQVYESLASAGKLPDVGAHKKVLFLEPKIHLRQVRARFHLNEASWRGVDALVELGPSRIGFVRDQIAKAKASNAVAAARLPAVDAWDTKAASALDGTLLAQRAADAAFQADPTIDKTPAGLLALATYASSTTTVTDAQLEARRVVSEAQSTIFHELASELDAIRRDITMSTDRTFGSEPARFMAWLKSADNAPLGTTKAALALNQTYDAFVAAYQKLITLPQPDQDAQVEAYNAYCTAQKTAGDGDFGDFNPIHSSDLAALGPQLLSEEFKIYQRQLEAAGTAVRTMWFDAARQHFIPSSYRQSGDFIIDSTDSAEYYSDEAWQSIPEAERTAASVLPVEKLLWATLSNDVQIELGQEKPYVDQIEQLEAQPASPARDAQLAGAKMIYDEYQKMLQHVSTLKGPKILKNLKAAGGPACMDWKPIDGAKGIIGFAKLRGK